MNTISNDVARCNGSGFEEDGICNTPEKLHPQCKADEHDCATAKKIVEARCFATACSPEEWWAKRAVEISVQMRQAVVEELIIRRKADGKYTFEITPEAGLHSA